MPQVYLCHGDENDCDDHATCTHTGPGTHDCACFLRYGGDGQTCAEQGVAQCLPDCTLQVLCPALPPLDGATIEYSNGMISPSVATYTCDRNGGPPDDGDATRECQADGSWSGVAPTQCAPSVAFTTDWMPMQGIGQQFTRCSSVSNNGLTCHLPEIKYGTTQGGIPRMNEMGAGTGNDQADAYCQTLGFRSAGSFVGAGGNAAVVFWATGYDESTSLYHWCDCSDGPWRSSNLDNSHCGARIQDMTCVP